MSGAPKPAAAPAPAKKAPQYKPDQVEYYDARELAKVDYDRVPEKERMVEAGLPVEKEA
jgi:hypothetical protein